MRTDRAEEVAARAVGRERGDRRAARRAQHARELRGRHRVARREHAPNEESTTSNESSSNGSASTSPSTQPTATPAAAARARAAGKCSGVRSTPVTRPPASAAGIGDVAGAARDVEHGGAGPDADALHEPLADLGHERRERRVVAGRPHRALGLLVVRQRIDHGASARGSRARAFACPGHLARAGAMA